MLAALAIISAFTTLATEGLKKLLDANDCTYNSNILAGIVAIVLSAAYGIGYTIIQGTAVTAALVIYYLCMCFLSWLCAMLGYDKVKQAIEQLTSGE